MKIPKHPRVLSITVEYLVNEMTDLNEIDKQIEEYQKDGWILEQRGMNSCLYELYSHIAYIKMTKR